VTGSLRVLHLPDVIGGHPPALAGGERLLGAHAVTLSCQPSIYDYPADIMLGASDDNFLKKLNARWCAFLDVRSSFDVYHFNFGASLLHFPQYGAILPELKYYQRSAARFMTWQGDDARLTYPEELDRSLAEERRIGRWAGARNRHEYIDPLRLLKRRLSIRRSAALCDHMFALNPDLLAHLPPENSSFLPYAIDRPHIVGVPQPDQERHARTPLRLVHLSTSPAIKGTGLIEAAVGKAKRTVAVELDVVIQQPRDQALRRLAAADYMIDQLVLGWYGGTVVEAMYLGVPAIGRICQTQAARVPDLSGELPIVRADADSLADIIINLAQQPEQRPALVRRGLEFSQKWHSPENVAVKTIAAYGAALSRRSYPSFR
jgi:hypothetical protein